MYSFKNSKLLVPDGVQENHMNTLNKTHLLQHRRSFGRSNITSHIINRDVWKTNSKLLNKQAKEAILQSAKELLQNAETSNNSTWKTSLSKFVNPETIFERSIPRCVQCPEQTECKITELFQDLCYCNLGIEETSSAPESPQKPGFVQSLSQSSNQRKSGDKQLFRPKFGRPRPKNQPHTSKSPNQEKCTKQERHHEKQFKQHISIHLQEKHTSNHEKCSSIQEIDLRDDEEENKAHKSNVGRNSFRTKEKYFASDLPNEEDENKGYMSRNSFKRKDKYIAADLPNEEVDNKAYVSGNFKTAKEKHLAADLQNEEEENKAHKSNVAKITFKTAREQFLASNPAAKRTLGASRKAQGKFVSPMIGAQDKQETSEAEHVITDERLKHIDPKMIELIESEIIDKGNPVSWDDIAGLQMAKSVIQEAVVWPILRPDIFTGLRRPPKGILLFGPPGTGKTLIGKCIAAQCNATFFSISASSLTSKWIGDGEKMVRALFAVARCHQPAVIFIDEIDSLLTQRNDTEHEATRRIKTEFLVQFDGAATGDEDRLLIVGATNRPQELDEAARRRLVKRLYIPLPDVDARKQMVSNLLSCEHHELTPQQIQEVAARAAGYSGADVRALCAEAAMGPVRAVPLHQIATIHRNQVRPVCVQDFFNALQRVRPSVSQDDLGQYIKWNNTYGQAV